MPSFTAIITLYPSFARPRPTKTNSLNLSLSPGKCTHTISSTYESIYFINIFQEGTTRLFHIGDFANVSKKITSIYLTFLSTPELIMVCRVFHLSTFRPPVDNAISCAHCRRRVFLSTVKSNV